MGTMLLLKIFLYLTFYINFLGIYQLHILIHFLSGCTARFNQTCIDATDHTMAAMYFLQLTNYSKFPKL